MAEARSQMRKRPGGTDDHSPPVSLAGCGHDTSTRAPEGAPEPFANRVLAARSGVPPARGWILNGWTPGVGNAGLLSMVPPGPTLPGVRYHSEGNFLPVRETRPPNYTPDPHFIQYSCGFFAAGNPPQRCASDHRTYTVVPCLANS